MADPTAGQPSGPEMPGPPESTGDQQVDEALARLAQVNPADIDAQLAAGQRFERDLSARLTDLAAE